MYVHNAPALWVCLVVYRTSTRAGLAGNIAYIVHVYLSRCTLLGYPKGTHTVYICTVRCSVGGCVCASVCYTVHLAYKWASIHVGTVMSFFDVEFWSLFFFFLSVQIVRISPSFARKLKLCLYSLSLSLLLLLLLLPSLPLPLSLTLYLAVTMHPFHHTLSWKQHNLIMIAHT